MSYVTHTRADLNHLHIMQWFLSGSSVTYIADDTKHLRTDGNAPAVPQKNIGVAYRKIGHNGWNKPISAATLQSRWLICARASQAPCTIQISGKSWTSTLFWDDINYHSHVQKHPSCFTPTSSATTHNNSAQLIRSGTCYDWWSWTLPTYFSSVATPYMVSLATTHRAGYTLHPWRSADDLVYNTLPTPALVGDDVRIAWHEQPPQELSRPISSSTTISFWCLPDHLMIWS